MKPTRTTEASLYRAINLLNFLKIGLIQWDGQVAPELSRSDIDALREMVDAILDATLTVEKGMVK
ncbi:MAG: hypothetical protein HQL95_08165 [Magnetococcales bacterium]|nr:hypothetical protein [Magnetococcales bacterium]